MADKDFDPGLPGVPGVFAADPEAVNENTWYGLLHTNHHFTVKRYFEYLDYKEACDSDFTQFFTRLFSAGNREDAMIEGERLIKAQLNGRA